MSNFLLLYSGGGSMPATPEEGAAVLKEWNEWFGGLGAAAVDGGNPIGPVTKTVAPGGEVSDGPASMLTGYSILKADSLDAAVEMAKGCPVLKTDGKVMVFETFNAM
jgi:hypothetical protein